MTVGRSRPLSGPSCIGAGGGWTIAECCEPRKEGLPWPVPSPAMASVRALCLGVNCMQHEHPPHQGPLEVPGR